jgi:hypothetical protein
MKVAKEYTANEGPVRIQYKCLVPIYALPEMKLRGLIISRTELCIMFRLPISTFMYLTEDRLRDYINRSQTHKCRNWEGGPVVSFLGLYV